MDFYTVLDEALELLQRHKRVTYRALKRQCGLDDAYLEDLKAEIIEARQLAVDQDGTMLVWGGEKVRAVAKVMKIAAIRETFVEEWVAAEVTKVDKTDVPLAGEVITQSP